MQHFSIPICFFPSTALFINNSRDFLLNMALQLDEELAYKVFDSPFDALEMIQKKHRKHDLLSHRCLREYHKAEETTLSNSSSNLAAVYAEIYNPNRFSDISVVIIDYAMPGMDGLDFCRRIQNTQIKKILLIEENHEALALEAFNTGVIHQFIQKDDPYVTELITHSVYELQWQYFQDMSDIIVRLLSIETPNCVHDKSFTDFFKTFRQERGVIEFYQMDNLGSFLLSDVDANVSFLMVSNESELKAYHDFARDNGAAQHLLEELSLGKKIPCFWSPRFKSQEIDWSNHLIPAHSLVANEIYFYSHVAEQALFELKQNKLFSYHRHLQDIDAEELFFS